MNTSRHYDVSHLSGVLGILFSSMLTGCLSVPLGSHDGEEKVCGERLRGDPGVLEQIVARTHYTDYYAVLTLDNFGRQWYSSEQFFLKRGGEYKALPFLKDTWGHNDAHFRPVAGTELWVAIRQDKVIDINYSNETVILFGEKGIRRRVPLRMVRRQCDAYVFGSGNRTLDVELKGARAVFDLTNGEYFVVSRDSGVQQE
jgi:hypothetical protein